MAFLLTQLAMALLRLARSTYADIDFDAPFSPQEVRAYDQVGSAVAVFFLIYVLLITYSWQMFSYM